MLQDSEKNESGNFLMKQNSQKNEDCEMKKKRNEKGEKEGRN